MKLKLHFLPFYLLFWLFIALAAGNFSKAGAESATVKIEPANDTKTKNLESLRLPPRGSPRGRRRGGTSRNNCPAFDSPLTALVPGQEISKGSTKSESWLAMTSTSRPTFWLYIPQLPATLSQGEFILQTEAGQDLARAALSLPKQAGAIAIRLPKNTQSALKAGKKYHWYFKIYCDQRTSEQNHQRDYIFVDAWIKKVTLVTESTLESQSSQESLLWYDILTQVGRQLSLSPRDNQLQLDWQELLDSVGLVQLNHLPIIRIYEL